MFMDSMKTKELRPGGNTGSILFFRVKNILLYEKHYYLGGQYYERIYEEAYHLGCLFQAGWSVYAVGHGYYRCEFV